MDIEDQLIIDAIKNSKNQPKYKDLKKRLVPFDEEVVDDLLLTKQDALVKIQQKEKRRNSHKKKLINDWVMTDFVNYLKSIIHPYGLTLETGPAIAYNFMSQLYDLLIKNLGESNNYILREYCEWWVSNYAATNNSHQLYMQNILNKKHIERFVNYFRSIVPVLTEKKIDNTTVEDSYKAGGLPMVLILKGVVIAAQFLKELNESNIFVKISNTLQKCSKDSILKCLDSTINNAPYLKSQNIAIEAIVSKVVISHNLSYYKTYQWNNLFKGEK